MKKGGEFALRVDQGCKLRREFSYSVDDFRYTVLEHILFWRVACCFLEWIRPFSCAPAQKNLVPPLLPSIGSLARKNLPAHGCEHPRRTVPC